MIAAPPHWTGGRRSILSLLSTWLSDEPVTLRNQFNSYIPERPPPFTELNLLPFWDTCARTSSTWSKHRLDRGWSDYSQFQTYRTAVLVDLL